MIEYFRKNDIIIYQAFSKLQNLGIRRTTPDVSLQDKGCEHVTFINMSIITIFPIYCLSILI